MKIDDHLKGNIFFFGFLYTRPNVMKVTLKGGHLNLPVSRKRTQKSRVSKKLCITVTFISLELTQRQTTMHKFLTVRCSLKT